MRILDNQRYWSFFKAYVICYVSLVGLFIVIDAFSNMDEFAKRADGIVEMSQVMGRYYLIHQSLFFDYLCGVIGMMAAIFTVTWMQRNNEQLAILAAGISTHRAIRPVLISSVIVSTFAVANQELIMPRYAEDLAKSHDDDGQRTVHVSSRYDSRSVMLDAVDADRATKTLLPFYATSSPRDHRRDQGVEGPAGDVYSARSSDGAAQGGLAGARGHDQPTARRRGARQASRETLTPVDDLSGFPPPYAPPSRPTTDCPTGDTMPRPPLATRAAAGPPEDRLRPHSEIPYLASLPPFPLCLNPGILRIHDLLDRKIELSRGNYFLKSSLTFQAMTRKPDWYKFATTRDLIEGLSDPSTEGPERRRCGDVRAWADSPPVSRLEPVVHEPAAGARGLWPQRVHQSGLRAGKLGDVLRGDPFLPVSRRFRSSCRRRCRPGRLCSCSERSRPCGGDRSGPDRSEQLGS